MSVNQLIKESLKRGDQSRLSVLLGLTKSAISDRINSEVEIDSVDFINAVCKVTGKPFSYFKKVELGSGAYQMKEEEELVALVGESESDHMRAEASGDAARYWREKYEALKKENDALKDDKIELQHKLNQVYEKALKFLK